MSTNCDTIRCRTDLCPTKTQEQPPITKTLNTHTHQPNTAGKLAFFTVGFLGGGAAGVGLLLAPVSNLPETLVQACIYAGLRYDVFIR
jgi:hypothetical protein